MAKSIIPKPYERKNGTWETVYYYGTDAMTGKRKKVTCYGKSEKEAKEKILEAISQIKTGTYIEHNKLTIENGLIQKNYIEVVKLPKAQHTEMRVLSVEEHQRLYEEIKKSSERYKIGVLMSHVSGNLSVFNGRISMKTDKR